MSNIRIEVFSGDYTNYDVYQNLINYIGQKYRVGCYGFWGQTVLDCAKQFENCRLLSNQSPEQDIWHFEISFENITDTEKLFRIACQIADFFKDHYQIIFAVDNKGAKFHLHFGVNAYSYYPDYPALTKTRMLEQMNVIQNQLNLQYPNKSITLQFQNKQKGNK